MHEITHYWRYKQTIEQQIDKKIYKSSFYARVNQRGLEIIIASEPEQDGTQDNVQNHITGDANSDGVADVTDAVGTSIFS